jgi:hypothetical protein
VGDRGGSGNDVAARGEQRAALSHGWLARAAALRRGRHEELMKRLRRGLEIPADTATLPAKIVVGDWRRGAPVLRWGRTMPKPCARVRLLAASLLLAALGCVQPAGEWPGPRADGSILLPSGWSLRPHGAQVELASDLPVRMALSPDGEVLAVQHAGYRKHVVTWFDTATDEVVDSWDLDTTWSGMVWQRRARKL